MRQYTIWDEMHRMQEEMNVLLDTIFIGEQLKGAVCLPTGESKDAAPLYRKPHSDIIETENALVANIEMPGMDKEDIKVNVTEDSIEVKAEAAQENVQENKEAGTSIQEQRFAGFYRQFPLPKHVDTQKIEASYKNGVLQLKIPKADTHKGKPLQIEIKDS